MISVHNHCSRIREAVQQCAVAQPHVPMHITDSWIRCFKEYRLDPALPRELYVVEQNELLERQGQSASGLLAAKTEMATLFQQIAKSDYAIISTDADADGVLLNYVGDPCFTHAASRSGLMAGAVWSERFQGTNGMGTCLQEQRPVMIHQADHYFFRNAGLTCAAAPILDWRGKILAVLDASGLANRVPRHVLDLVNTSVLEIENRIFMSEHAQFQLLLVHTRPEFVHTLYKGIIAVDHDRRVVAASRNAMAQLGTGHEQMVGQPLDSLFNLSFESLLRSSQKNGAVQTPVMAFDVRHGRRLFAFALSGTRAVRGQNPIDHVFAAVTAAHSPQDITGPASCNPLEQLLCGQDAVMSHNITTALRIVERDIAILLYGETGTGKELFAKAVHLSSNRAHRPYVAINCASIPESLIESELFGYKPGAFTGASKDGQLGKIFQANGGTLFLDEIGDMPMVLQARLLRVLEEREVTPLGSQTPIKLDIRLISATHCDLLNKITKGEFREDLYYRIHGVSLQLPPLRERGDRRALIYLVLKQELSADEQVRIDGALMDVLEQYRWPGNIRQLRNVLRTMVALRASDVLTVDSLPPDFFARGPLEEKIPAKPTLAGLFNPLETAERAALIQELKKSRWNLSKVAAQLQLSRNTLYRKLERLDIKPALRDSY